MEPGKVDGILDHFMEHLYVCGFFDTVKEDGCRVKEKNSGFTAKVSKPEW